MNADNRDRRADRRKLVLHLILLALSVMVFVLALMVGGDPLVKVLIAVGSGIVAVVQIAIVARLSKQVQ